MPEPWTFRASQRAAEHGQLLYLASIDFPHVKARAIQIVNTAHALARAGFRVTLVVGKRSRGRLDEQLGVYGLAPHPNLRVVGVPALRLPPGAPRWLRRFYTRFWNWSYLAACLVLLPALLRARPLAILARDYRLAWLLLRLRRWHRRPLVFEVHGLPSVELLDAHRSDPRYKREADRRRDLEQAVFDGAWRLLTITDCLRARLIRDYAITPDRVFTVPDASGLRVTPHPTPRTPAHEPRGAADTTQLIYVGQLYPHKGVDLLLHALTEVPRAFLTIVGGLPADPNRARLEALAAQLGVAERVRFVGPRPYREIPSLLERADIALLPLADGIVARCFTSPLKLYDYLAAGLPIVAVDFPTVRETLRDGENGLLVPPNDPPALAAAINRLIDDPALAARLASQAREDAAEYTWDRRAERIAAALSAPATAAPRWMAGP